MHVVMNWVMGENDMDLVLGKLDHLLFSFLFQRWTNDQ